MATAARENRAFYLFNALVSTGALGFLAWLLLLREGDGTGADLSFLPAVNAGLNSLAACLLVAGWIAIRGGRRDVHRYLMVSAFAASSLFLVSYVIYHYVHQDTPYQGQGLLRPIYFGILISHVLLSMTVVPMALTAFWLAYKQRFVKHKRVTRVLTPVWLYVSVTGVVIFLMLHGA